MIRVSVDMIPLGFESRKRSMYTLEITNIGSRGMSVDKDGCHLYSYKVKSFDSEGNKYDNGVVVEGFDRNQPVYQLINIITDKLHKEGAFKNFK